MQSETRPGYVGASGVPSTVADVLMERAEASGDARFVTFQDEHVTYADAVVRAMQAAAAFASLGVAKGDKVAVMLPNSLEFLDIWFGCAFLGAALVPVNMGLKGDGLNYIVQHSDAHLAVVDETVIDVFDSSVATTGRLARFVRADASAGDWVPFAELIGGGYRAVPQTRLEPADLASVLYTSGTTGRPKGVMNCHNAYLTTGYEFAQQHVGLREDDILYTSLPLFHVNAQMTTTMGSILSGRPMVLAPRFSASGLFADMRRHEATIFNYIGAMLTMLYKQTQHADDATSPARLAVGGAAPKELWPDFERRFGLTILEIYGLTETATYCLGSPTHDIRVGKVGVPVSWADVEVHRPDGTQADSGEPGEIVIRANRPNVLFHGYYKSPEATTEAMRDGWFHSGDRGRRDADGYFVFIDRLKDTIRRRGENISSYEVERAVNSHPSVAESAAVGVPSELGEEDVLIVIVPKPGLQPEPAEIVSHCADLMAAFMVPRYVKFVDRLPKTATERVQKFELRADGIGSAWDSAAASEAVEQPLQAESGAGSAPNRQ